MSPQIFSREKYTEKTDIWSLGVILYEMLYGKIPWKAKSLIELKEKVWNQAIEFPPSPIITAPTKKLIQSMLQR
jgi:serine/threonine protein kinase